MEDALKVFSHKTPMEWFDVKSGVVVIKGTPGIGA